MTLPDPEELPLPPRSFTTFFRYALALSTYFGGYASAYLAFILLASVPATREMMSDILTSLGVQIDQVVGSPAWGAVLVTAILPSVKGFKQVDDWGRGRLQDFASIPVKAKLISEELVDHLKGGKLEINENSSRQQISAAIKIHRERFEHLQTAWKKLHQITAPIAGRRYRKFYKENDQKIMQRFEHEFAGRPAEGKTLDLASARHIEDHHREAVLRLARYIICGMLLSEGTEYRVRDRLKNELKINVKQNALNFGFKHLVVLVIMVIVVIVSTYFSAFIYHLWYGVSPICTSAAGHYDCSAHAELREIFSHNIQFFGWGIQTFIMYALPIAVAAAAAMFKLDQKASKSALNPIDYLFLAILTFAATAMLCFFMLLAFGITIPKYLGGTELKLNVLVPWIIPPALVATVFMWISVRNDEARGKLFYIGWLAFAALAGNLLAWLIGISVKANYGEMMQNQGFHREFLRFLVFFNSLSIGSCLGFLLSFTRDSAESTQSTMARATAKFLHRLPGINWLRRDLSLSQTRS